MLVAEDDGCLFEISFLMSVLFLLNKSSKTGREQDSKRNERT